MARNTDAWGRPIVINRDPKATPAPWLIDADGDIQDSEGYKLADMHITSEANRQVMVAAPAMLALLKYLLEDMDNEPKKYPRWKDKIRPLIAEAEGRDS